MHLFQFYVNVSNETPIHSKAAIFHEFVTSTQNVEEETNSHLQSLLQHCYHCFSVMYKHKSDVSSETHVPVSRAFRCILKDSMFFPCRLHPSLLTCLLHHCSSWGDKMFIQQCMFSIRKPNHIPFTFVQPGKYSQL